jgi:hypothetical protein
VKKNYVCNNKYQEQIAKYVWNTEEVHLELEMSRTESNLTELGSIRIIIARNSARVHDKLLFKLKLDSIQAHEQLGSAR